MNKEEFYKQMLEKEEERNLTYLDFINYSNDNKTEIDELFLGYRQFVKYEMIRNCRNYKRRILLKEINSLKNNYILLNNINTMLNILNKETFNITENILLDIDENYYLELIDKLSTLCYEYCKKNSDVDELEELSNLLNLTKENIRWYLIKGFSLNDIDTYQVYIVKKRHMLDESSVPRGKYFEHISKIDELNGEELNNYVRDLIKQEVKLEYIRNNIYVYVMRKYINYGNEFKINKENELKDKIKNTAKKVKSLIKKENDVTKEEAENIVINFIDSNTTVGNYLLKNNISRYTFDKYLRLIKVNNKDLYERYRNATRNNTFLYFANEIKKARIIMNEIINNEDFDLIDFYRLTRKEPTDYYNFLRGIMDEQELRPLKIFASNNFLGKEWNRYKLETFFKTRILIDGEEISLDNKNEIIESLQNSSVPITAKTLDLSIKRKEKEILKKQRKM